MLAATGAARPEGLIGYWPFDRADASADVIADRSGKNRDGTLIGGPTFVSGRRREALAFDGVDDRVAVGDLLPTGVTQLSAAAWVNATDVARDQVIISKASSSSPADPGYSWSFGLVGNTVRVGLQSGNGPANFDGPTIQANRWYHLAFTYDGAYVRTYVNGRLRATAEHSGAIPASDSAVVIGGNADGANDVTFAGRLDEVQLYDRALSSRSVLNLGYRSSTSLTPAVGLRPAPLISEDFASGPGGFAAVDGVWSASGGAYGVTAAGSAAGPLDTRSVHSTVVSGDFTLAADASVADTSSAWNDFAVVFGYQDPSNYYFFSSNESNDGGTNGLFKVVNGVSTELADAAGTITAGATYQVRVERSGGTVSCYRNGQLVASATDPAFPSGRVGFGTRGDSATFDNLLVTAAAPAPQPAAPAAAPSNLTAAAVSPSQINLAWSDNSSNEAGFKVERSADGVNFAQVAAVGPDVTSYPATGLAPSTSYTFRVRAYNAAGDSAYSNAAAATTPAAAPATGGDTLGGFARPSAATTGLTDPSLLVARPTTLATTADGQVIENIDFTGGAGVTVLNNNVTIRNCRFSGGSISAGGEGAVRSGVVVRDCEMVDAAGLGGGISLYRNYVHGIRDGDFWRNPSNCTWQGNYFTDVYATSTAPHIDMIQWYWSNPAQRISSANLVVRGNYWDVDNTYPLANQFNAILFNDQNMNDITWEYNWMHTGGYVIRTNNGTGITFNGNVWEGWGWGPMLTMGGYSNIAFTNNQILLNGSLQPFEKPPGANSNLWSNS